VTTRVKRRAAAAPARQAAPAGRQQAARTPRAAGETLAGHGDLENGPVIVLSYAYSGADRVQDALAADADLACTAGTGIIPQCAAIAETWLGVEARDGRAMSRLAAVTIRHLAAAQLTAILAGTGKARWCELSTTAPGTAEPFRQVFPGARFVCVHRSCLDVVRAGVQASRWGVQGQGLLPYVASYPGNNVAALAAYWAASAEQLLAFEEASPEVAHRVRYEDVTAGPGEALATIRAALRLESSPEDDVRPSPPDQAGPEATPPGPEAKVPAEMIPEPLRQRIARLHAQLGYPPPRE
jgi:hypothetical protein